MFTRETYFSQVKSEGKPHPQKAARGGRESGGQSMNWREATAVSLVLTMANVFIVFLTLYDLSSIALDPASFAFDLFKFAGASFFGTFITLTELFKYQSR